MSHNKLRKIMLLNVPFCFNNVKMAFILSFLSDVYLIGENSKTLVATLHSKAPFMPSVITCDM